MHSQVFQFTDAFRQEHAIGGQAQHQLRKVFFHQAKGLKGILVGQGIAGTGNPNHAHVFASDGVAHHQPQSIEGFAGRQHPTGDAGSVFVGTIELALTKAALDIAAGSHRQMNPSGLFMVTAKTGVSPFVCISRTGCCCHDDFSFHKRPASRARRAANIKSPEIIKYPEASLPYFPRHCENDCRQIVVN